MMVKMAEVATRGDGAPLRLWHDTTVKLASLMLPLAALLFLSARAVIIVLFTKTYIAAIPILRVWCLMVVPSAFAVDGVLRAHAQTRFLLVMNVVRLVVIVGLVGWLISVFGIVGAVLATLVGTVVVKTMAIAQIARVMNVGLSDVLPWKRLALTTVNAGIPLAPAWAVMDIVSGPVVLSALLSVAVYGAFYAGLWYVLQIHVSPLVARALHPRWPSPLPLFNRKSSAVPAASGLAGLRAGRFIVCGIAGIVRFDGEPVFEHEIRAMCQMLVHRGPDEEVCLVMASGWACDA
jgi:hypothetical protein